MEPFQKGKADLPGRRPPTIIKVMKLDSKYFDRIRINRDAATRAPTGPTCEWEGCREAGTYRAPKGRAREGEYFRFCLDHVRVYNKSYNYFAGMADDDIMAYQRASATGHRPTWSMGVKQNRESGPFDARRWDWGIRDPFGMFGEAARQADPQPEETRRQLRNVERRSFAALDLEGTESGPEIKARYKTLVKRLHPDANGGDRSLEDKLRQIIQAYAYLRSAGFC